MTQIKVTVDLSGNFKGLDGKDVPGVLPIAQVVGGCLYNGSSAKETRVRNVNWALKLYNEPSLQLEPKEMDDILLACEQGGLKDGYYVTLEKIMDDAKMKWKELKEASPKG